MKHSLEQLAEWSYSAYRSKLKFLFEKAKKPFPPYLDKTWYALGRWQKAAWIAAANAFVESETPLVLEHCEAHEIFTRGCPSCIDKIRGL